MQKNRDGQHLDIHERVIKVSRCTKVVKGGRNFSFGVLAVVGDSKGRVGLGFGKALEAQDAKEKAIRDAKGNMVKVPLRDGRTIHHGIKMKFGAGSVIMRSAPPGTGIIAGGAMRSLFEVLGVRDIVAKSVGSTNPHNMVKACLKGLLSVESPKQVAERRAKRFSEIIERRSKLKKGAALSDRSAIKSDEIADEEEVTDKEEDNAQEVVS